MHFMDAGWNCVGLSVLFSDIKRTLWQHMNTDNYSYSLLRNVSNRNHSAVLVCIAISALHNKYHYSQYKLTSSIVSFWINYSNGEATI